MKTLKSKTGREVKIFTDNIEETALEQINDLINNDVYANNKIRIMSDVHAGKGCTIGTTMVLNGKVTPNLVGVDIGCGMLTVKLFVKEKDIDFKKLDYIINVSVPSGKNIHHISHVTSLFNLNNLIRRYEVDVQRAKMSIGTLGGGNHFIELVKGKNDDIFLIIHSGSRNLGNQIAKIYQKTAEDNIVSKNNGVVELIEKLKSEGREKEIQSKVIKLTKKNESIQKELAYLEDYQYDDYIHDINIVQQYASLNRETIADIIMDKMKWKKEWSMETIHNYIEINEYTGEHLLRKGAVSAKEGEDLLIPINMRDGSLLCIGKGNKDWNYSAPHGAGRLMSRTKAKNELDVEIFEKQMSEVYTTSVNKNTLDEAPDAYKPIEEIIDNIKDTVDVIDILKPIYNFKAH